MSRHTEASALAEFTTLLADRTRAAICLALLDGRAWTAGELAKMAKVSPSTATGHLDRLIAGGVLTERRQGRHRYVQLADPRIAALIEDLSAHLRPVETPVTGFKAVTAAAALARGRTCYDHLAGRIGVAVTDAMIAAGLIDTDGGFALNRRGLDWLATELDIDTTQWSRQRRPVTRECLDWTERRSHLAGLSGAAVCREFLERGWLRRIGTGRAVRGTPAGRAELPGLLPVDPAVLE